VKVRSTNPRHELRDRTKGTSQLPSRRNYGYLIFVEPLSEREMINNQLNAMFDPDVPPPIEGRENFVPYEDFMFEPTPAPPTHEEYLAMQAFMSDWR
jgi:hypothetical protein